MQRPDIGPAATTSVHRLVVATPRPSSTTSPIGKSNYYVGTAWRKCSTWKALFVGRHSALLALLVDVTDGIDNEIWLIERDVL